MIAAIFSKRWVKYLLLVLLLAAAFFAIQWAWHTFIAEPYREQGRIEIRALWSAEKAEMQKKHADEIAAARQKERHLVAAANALAHKTREELENEKDQLQSALDKYRAADRRMRRIQGEVVTPNPDGVPGPGPGNARPIQTCEARLPREIGEGFERLRETALRIGSEANETALRLNAAQTQLQDDRAP